MNETVALLNKALELEKKAYIDYVTSFSSSGIAALVKGGVAFEKAASLIQEACSSDGKAQSLASNIAIFEKVAEYIDQQDARIQELEKSASEIKQEVESRIDPENPLNKLASIGFSKEEIEMMAELPDNLLTKVASANSQPWELGGGAGFPREKTDPILEFILGG